MVHCQNLTDVAVVESLHLRFEFPIYLPMNFSAVWWAVRGKKVTERLLARLRSSNLVNIILFAID